MTTSLQPARAARPKLLGGGSHRFGWSQLSRKARHRRSGGGLRMHRPHWACTSGPTCSDCVAGGGSTPEPVPGRPLNPRLHDSGLLNGRYCSQSGTAAGCPGHGSSRPPRRGRRDPSGRCRQRAGGVSGGRTRSTPAAASAGVGAGLATAAVVVAGAGERRVARAAAERAAPDRGDLRLAGRHHEALRTSGWEGRGMLQGAGWAAQAATSGSSPQRRSRRLAAITQPGPPGPP